MKQSIVEVVVYLLETVASRASNLDDSFADQSVIKQMLEEAGFTKNVVANTFDWLRELIDQQCWYASSVDVDTKISVKANKTLRIFNQEEAIRISLEVRNFILSLEYADVLDTKMREIVISQLMQLDQNLVELIDAKWVVLLVLMSKSNRNIQDMHNYLLTTMVLKV